MSEGGVAIEFLAGIAFAAAVALRVECQVSLPEAATSIIFVATKVLSKQSYFSRDKTRVLSRQTRVVKKICLLLQIFVATKVLSRQIRVCCDKLIFVATKYDFFRDKHVFVAIKIILVVDLANDSKRLHCPGL